MKIEIDFKNLKGNQLYDTQLFDVDLNESESWKEYFEEELVDLTLEEQLEKFGLFYSEDVSENLCEKYEFEHGEYGGDEATLRFKWKDIYFDVHYNIDWNRYDKQFYFIEAVSYMKYEIVEVTGDGIGIITKIKNILGDVEYDIDLVTLEKL
jgi:hypothetical protein